MYLLQSGLRFVFLKKDARLQLLRLNLLDDGEVRVTLRAPRFEAGKNLVVQLLECSVACREVGRGDLEVINHAAENLKVEIHIKREPRAKHRTC